MPKTPRYEARDDGTLYDRKKQEIIHVKEFDVKRSGRIEVIRVVTDDGQNLKIARWAIDETKYSFGPVSSVPSACRRHQAAVGEPSSPPREQAALILREVTLKLPREQALQFLYMLRGVTDLIFQQLIGETMERRP